MRDSAVRGVFAKQNLPIFALLLVLTIGSAIRVFHLAAMPIFTDEAIYANWVLEMWESRTRAALFIPIHVDGKQPLFMWMATAMMTLVPDPLLAGRLVSSLSGSLSLVGVYLLGRKLYGPQVGVLAAAAYSILPLATFHERLSLVDPLLSSLVLWATVASVYSTTASSSRAQTTLSLAAGVLLGAAVWTKASALVFAFLPALSQLLLAKHSRRTYMVSIALCYAPLGVAAAALAFAPESPLIAAKAASFIYPLSAHGVDWPTVWRVNSAKLLAWAVSYIGWSGIVMALVGTNLQPSKNAYFLWVWAIIPAITLAIIGENTFSRYILPGSAPIAVLIASGLLVAWTAVRKRWASTLLPALVTATATGALVVWPWVAFSSSLLFDPARVSLSADDRYQYIADWPSGYGLPEAFSIVESAATSLDRPVILLTDTSFGLPRDAARVRFYGSSLVFPRSDMAVAWGGRSLITDWKVHRVMTFILLSDYRDSWQNLERNNPELRPFGVFWKPDGKSYFRLYGVDFGAEGADTTPAANTAAGAS